MKVCIQNEQLTVTADSLGGELQSIRDKEGTEYLWQGDKCYWDGKAPNLFPYIARLTEESYWYRGKKYAMGIHGFVWNSQLKPVVKKEDTAVFRLVSDRRTRDMYPFDFIYEITYHLEENRLEITYQVTNMGEEDMYFGIGGHPGFRVPLDSGCVFEDYDLEFADACHPQQIIFSEDCFVTDGKRKILTEGNKLHLQHTLFEHDAIVMENMAEAVTLSAKNGSRYVRVEYPQMSYLGIWHAPNTEAPYICIEPWSSLPSRKGIIEDLETQENLIRLEKGQVYTNQWSITCGTK